MSFSRIWYVALMFAMSAGCGGSSAPDDVLDTGGRDDKGHDTNSYRDNCCVDHVVEDRLADTFVDTDNDISETGGDQGSDSGNDVEIVDSVVDQGHDVVADVTQDVSVDTAVDGGNDVTGDSAVQDAVTDAGQGLACLDEPPEWHGDPSWTGEGTSTLEFGQDAVYCWTFNESLTLAESLKKKSKLYLIPGSYQVPASGEGLAITLPFCTEFAAGVDGPVHEGTGSVRVAGAGIIYSQPMTDGESWDFSMNLYTMTPPLNGEHGQVFMSLCKGGCASWTDNRNYDSCTFENVGRQVHTVVFDGGSITLELRIGTSMASTEPGIFYSASGEIDGTQFEIEDYWDLVYRPGHHHFVRNFAVMLDPEVYGACAVMVENAVPWTDQPDVELPTVSLAGCDLTPTGTRTVTSHTMKRIDP